MEKHQSLWSREELILAFNLYLTIPFGKMHRRTPEVIQLAELIGRSPNSISMRLGNFASVDPYHQKRGVSGLTGGIRQVQPIWDEFFNNQEELVFQSEKLRAEKEKSDIETKFQSILIDILDLKGQDKVRQIKTRVNQYVFRDIVLNNFSRTCCITGIKNPELLVAGHIKPWSLDENNRLNPRNGLSMNGLHDRAFETGLLTITPDYKVKISRELLKSKDKAIDQYFAQYDGKEIILPSRFLPDPELLKYHNNERFKP